MTVVRRELGEAVRSAREASGTSLRQLAGAIDVNPNTLMRMEQGGQAPLTMERARRLATAVDEATSTIFAGVLNEREAEPVDLDAVPLEHVVLVMRAVLDYLDEHDLPDEQWRWALFRLIDGPEAVPAPA